MKPTKTRVPVTNPFLPPPPPAPVALPDRSDHADDPVAINHGPSAPTGAPAPQHPPLVLPPWLVARQAGPPLHRLPLVQFVGLHGGAGTTTLTHVLGEGAWGCPPDLRTIVSANAPIVLVARTHAHGVDLARRAGQQWASGALDEVNIIGLALVPDLPQLPRSEQRGLDSLAKIFPTTWRMPWVAAWRTQPHPPKPDQLDSRVKRIRKDLLRTAAAASATAVAGKTVNQQRKSS